MAEVVPLEVTVDVAVVVAVLDAELVADDVKLKFVPRLPQIPNLTFPVQIVGF